MSLVLSSLVFNHWQWCLKRSITVAAQHLPGCLNVTADYESRANPDAISVSATKQQMGALLNQSFHNKTDCTTVKICELETRSSGGGSGCFHTGLEPIHRICFPSICTNRPLSTAHQQQSVSQITIVTPVWETQPWYPLLLGRIIDTLVLLPVYPGLLRDKRINHTTQNHLGLVVQKPVSLTPG